MEKSVAGILFFHFILIAGVAGFLDEQQPHRTAFHFQPPKNWMNDPNGPMYYNGVYHLFYQYNPHGATWAPGNLSWAHSVSYNLIDWIHLEDALAPTEPYDVAGCWSGSATVVDGKPLLLYTGINSANQQVQNLAMPKDLSDPLLREWVKFSGNPLITPDEDMKPDSFRDPTTAWRKPGDNSWRLLIGSEINGHGSAILYRSDDFVRWKRADGVFHSSEKTGMWECPDFYPVSAGERVGLDTAVDGLDVRHVLMASFNSRDYYVIGSYDDSGSDEFAVEVDFMDDDVRLSYDYGVLYASKTFYDGGRKRRVLWGWVAEADTEAGAVARGWAGLQSLPRSILLDKNGKQLIQWPVEEVEKLRGSNITIENKEIESRSFFEIEGITASQADVEVSFRIPNLEGIESIDEQAVDPQLLCLQKNASEDGVFGPFGLLVLASEDLTERSAVFFRVYKRSNKFVVLMCSDQSRSSLQTLPKQEIFGSFLDVDPEEEISLRTLIDHSIIESFGGKGKSCITARVYPKLAILENSHIYAFNNGRKSVTISRLSGWSMKKAEIVEAHTLTTGDVGYGLKSCRRRSPDQEVLRF